jgi:hypothetical protein
MHARGYAGRAATVAASSAVDGRGPRAVVRPGRDLEGPLGLGIPPFETV